MALPANFYSPRTGQLFDCTKRLDLPMRRNDNPWRRRFPVMTYPIPFTDPNGGLGAPLLYEAAPLDTTNWSMRMQVRLYEGQPGTPIVALDLATYTPHSDGTPFSDDAPYSEGTSPNGSGMVPGVGFVETFVTLSDLALLPAGPFNEGPIRFSYDLMLQPPGGDENAWYSGDIIFSEGVTRYAVVGGNL